MENDKINSLKSVSIFIICRNFIWMKNWIYATFSEKFLNQCKEQTNSKEPILTSPIIQDLWKLQFIPIVSYSRITVILSLELELVIKMSKKKERNKYKMFSWYNRKLWSFQKRLVIINYIEQKIYSLPHKIILWWWLRNHRERVNWE